MSSAYLSEGQGELSEGQEESDLENVRLDKTKLFVIVFRPTKALLFLCSDTWNRSSLYNNDPSVPCSSVVVQINISLLKSLDEH